MSKPLWTILFWPIQTPIGGRSLGHLSKLWQNPCERGRAIQRVWPLWRRTMTDDKPTNTISLAAERGKRERDFAAERDLLTRELADIGVPPEKASAIVADLLLIDWWCLQATVILARWDLKQNAEAAVELVKIMARGPRD